MCITGENVHYRKEGCFGLYIPNDMGLGPGGSGYWGFGVHGPWSGGSGGLVGFGGQATSSY